MQAADTETQVSDEQRQVELRREKEAIRAGLSLADAYQFAHSDADIGVLRFLAKKKCPADLIARIVL